MSNDVTLKPSEVMNNPECIEVGKDGVASLLALIESLSYEICSNDIWNLAVISAQNIAIQKYGVDEVVFVDIMKRVNEARKSKNKQNPMSAMF